MAKITQSISYSDVAEGITVKIDGDLIEGVESIALIGPSATTFPDTKLIDTIQKEGRGIPTAGSCNLQIAYNGADPTHEKIRNSITDRSSHSFEILTRGKLVNGLRTNTAEEQTDAFKAATVSTAGVLAVEDAPAPVRIGDYLEPSSGDDLIVTGANYATDPITLNVKKSGTGTITAVTSSKTYTHNKPAEKYTFNGFIISAFPNPQSGAIKSPVAIRIDGNVTHTLGTPNLT